MLTVVGIIAVLVSVSIPVVNSSLEKAQKATDAANERAAKGAMLMESLLTENTGGTSMYYDNAAGQWKKDPPSVGYGKCETHKERYLKGTMNSSGEVVLEWMKSGETPVKVLCSETLMAETSGGGGTICGTFTVQGDGFSFDPTGGGTSQFGDEEEKELGELKIDNGATVTIRSDGQPTENRIEIAGGAKHTNITLVNVNIEISRWVDGTSAFKIADDSAGDVTITLIGENKLTVKNSSAAGLQKNGGEGMLTITGEDGTLEATGDSSGAGIGGSSGKSTKNITIIDCKKVIAKGGTGAAGIGGGGNGSGSGAGSGSNIIISNSTVEATGGKLYSEDHWGDDIGSGYGASSGSGIKVNGNEYTPNKTGVASNITPTNPTPATTP